MRFAALAAVAVMAWSTASASAAPLSYLDFISLPSQQRALYVAGAFDQFVTIYAPPAPDGSFYQDFVEHIGACVADRGLDAVGMQAGLVAFAITQPELQTGPIPILLMEYLIAECGLPVSG